MDEELDKANLEIKKLQAELACCNAMLQQIEEWVIDGEKITEVAGIGFKFGTWWADRPWRKRRF